MVFVYIRIYFAAKARARRGIRKIPRRQPTDQQVTSFTNDSTNSSKKGTQPMPHNPNQIQSPTANPPPPVTVAAVVDRNSNQSEQQQIATIETHQTVQIPIVTCDFASDISTSDAGDLAEQMENKDTLQVYATVTTVKNPLSQYRGGSTLSVNGELQQQLGRQRAPSMGIDTDMVSEFDPSSSDSGVVSRCAVVKPLKLRLCQPIFGKRTHKTHKHKETKQDVIQPAPPKVQKPRDPEREKRRIARKKEKRATLILGLIMGSFIACWLPFFFLYILTPACSICSIPDSAFAFAFWMGYMNSALNPVIYTIFNKDFRRAFRRILFK